MHISGLYVIFPYMYTHTQYTSIYTTTLLSGTISWKVSDELFCRLPSYFVKMPSIGGTEYSRSKDRGLEDISSVISEGFKEGKTSSVPLKSTGGSSPAIAGKQGGTDTVQMAPYKNGEMESDCKTTRAQNTKEDIQASPSNGIAKTEAGAAGQETDGKNGCEDKDGSTMNGRVGEPQESSDGTAESVEGNEKTADQRRKDYKEKPRASSVEILGLKKQFAKIKNQGQLDASVYQIFESEMKRRKSSPGHLSSVRSIKIKEEEEQGKDHGGMEDLVTGMKKVDLEADGKAGFATRVESDAPQSKLVSKGPLRPSLNQVRNAPYHTGQTGVVYQSATPAPVQHLLHGRMGPGGVPNTQGQQVHLSHRQGPIRPSTKKVQVPGMPSQQQQQHLVFKTLADGRTMHDLSSSTVMHQHQPQPMQIQMNQPMQGSTRRVPIESTWPPSPTDQSYPNSPLSTASLSPDPVMHMTPSPQGFLSPQHPQPSPQAMMSPDSSSNGMSPSPHSPHSPHSPEIMSLNSPPSVRSDDSGISSPSHISNQYTSSSGTNAGTVIDNSQCYRPDPVVTLDNLQYIIQPQQQRTVLTPEDQKRRQQIKTIEDNLISSANEFENNSGSGTTAYRTNLDNANVNCVTLQQQQQQPAPAQHYYQQHRTHHQHQQQQHLVRQGHVVVTDQAIPVPRMLQMVQPATYVMQDQNQNLEHLVNSMPLDTLCSQDEDNDTALHIAISQGNLALCQIIIARLVKCGRKDALNIRDKLGQTPLYIAVVTNQPKLLLILLQAGADVMIPNKDRMTPLHYAATKGYAQTLVAIGFCLCQDLITNWDINVEDKNGMSPLQCAVQAHGRYEQVYDGTQCRYVNKMVDSLDTVKNLLKLGADPAFKDKCSGYTALHFAVELAPNEKVTANKFIIQLILDFSQDAAILLGQTNYAGNTALHVIAGRNYDEDEVVRVINLLISYGAEIQVQNHEKLHPHDLVNKRERKKVYSTLQGDHLQGK